MLIAQNGCGLWNRTRLFLVNGEAHHLDANPQIKWSGIRESNPFPQLGRLVPGRSANPAQDSRIVKEQPVVGYRGLELEGFSLWFSWPRHGTGGHARQSTEIPVTSL
jgi:hypothetical protein